MAQQFQDQGGAATMDPGRLQRWVTSRLMTALSRESRLLKRRARSEKARIKAGEPHRVEYFHQCNDGYSHLAAQVLARLQERYDIELNCHLVNGPSGPNLPEPELLIDLARRDAQQVAAEYGLSFPAADRVPDAALVQAAAAILAAQNSADFAAVAPQVSAALWRSDSGALKQLAQEHGEVSADKAQERNKEGDQRLRELQHYSGAMFYYGGEWYWGVDRLYHLEKRLQSLGADKSPADALLMPRPPIETGPLKDNGSLTLEIYPSLRSPYTSISFDRALDLAAKTGVNLSVRPVLPMVMRGVPATRQKGIYIFTDTAREAREAGVPYGNFRDPIGEPVRRAYALYPWACEQGRGNEFLSAFLSCAFARGVNTNSERGLERVVAEAGLDWDEAQAHRQDTRWEALLEENRRTMYASGLWGVPSFRLLGPRGDELLALWGQDRLWLVAREIQRQIARNQTPE